VLKLRCLETALFYSLECTVVRMIAFENSVVARRERSEMGFDFSCSNILYDTLEELREISLELENLFCSVEDSLGDVVWFFRLMGGKVIVDHSDSLYGGEIMEWLEFVECDLGWLAFAKI
jgi:hypothetical protein